MEMAKTVKSVRVRMSTVFLTLHPSHPPRKHKRPPSTTLQPRLKPTVTMRQFLPIIDHRCHFRHPHHRRHCNYHLHALPTPVDNSCSTTHGCDCNQRDDYSGICHYYHQLQSGHQYHSCPLTNGMLPIITTVTITTATASLVTIVLTMAMIAFSATVHGRSPNQLTQRRTVWELSR